MEQLALKDPKVIEERKEFISTKGAQKQQVKCDEDSVAGSISQRACVFCGARVVLNPITDAIHLVHGPIGCASYTWDIRGSLTSGSNHYRNSFSTDMKEKDVIFGGEKKLAIVIDELVEKYKPKLIFVYSTCIVGVIGDDLEAVCKKQAQKYNIEIIPVQSSGFIGNKSAGYRAACDALLRLIAPAPQEQLTNNGETSQPKEVKKKSKTINYLGDFNLAAEAWIIKNYLKEIGVEINVTFTGDSDYVSLKKAPEASLNIIQCAGSMTYLAKKMEEIYDIPFIHISFLGIEDTKESIRKIARFFNDPEIEQKAEQLIARELKTIESQLDWYKQKLQGTKAAIYVGGGFKAISLLKQFKELGVEVVMVGTQTGRKEEYQTISELATEGTVILDDANPTELEQFMTEKGADLLVGGVKERPLAYKLGLAFIDHNHDRKHPLSGFVGAVNFAKEVYSTVCSPVWKYV
ncbi:nitrogenase iron-molybdenum cofactor biosynthesis protein NifE [Desulfuribacillus stibiiarsenatis]|uniref:Nitrogenase iron-molybdenum cofactor biosynthesis protein NifE n=1 Tax=Desulfuribacillus stibiiarsenatis TaxID=1390249 RepID=A0A1E5L3C2_9FIRM|nr:nitrogenase iron-molybdenum cofactor biosynthesis protein NifE [Desulfuribacillus stibiiarsenatis]OEH84640.1 nitrogenase iron-molybdenum cofactor biosynthesis protein NifE [Desulfuribacillus stibiiarsenatis]